MSAMEEEINRISKFKDVTDVEKKTVIRSKLLMINWNRKILFNKTFIVLIPCSQLTQKIPYIEKYLW